MSMSVCVSVCLSVCSRNSKTTWLNFTKFLCMLHVATARSSSDGVTIHYVLLVLWTMACFHTMGPMVGEPERQNKVAGQSCKFDCTEAASIECYVRQLQCLVEFITILHWGEVCSL